MDEARNAFEFLEGQSTQNSRKRPSFSTLMDFLDGKARKEGIPLNGQFELTPLCNFDCKMCYAHLNRQQMQGKDLLTAGQWKDLMTQAWKAGMMSANLTGGECLAYPGFEEIYLFLRDLGCEILVLTNGYFLEERWIRFFQRHKPRLIQITLYGGNEETYFRVTGQRAFATVRRNIQQAIEADLPIALTLTPSRYLGDGAADTVRVAHDLGVHYSINGLLTEPKPETGRAGKDHDLSIEAYARMLELRNQLEGIPTTPMDASQLPRPGGPYRTWNGCGLQCKAGLSCFTMEWDGRLFACGSIRDIWAEPLKDGFLNAWKKVHEKALQYPMIPECIACPYASACTNCTPNKMRFAEAGKPPMSLCEQTRYLVERGVKRIPGCE